MACQRLFTNTQRNGVTRRRFACCQSCGSDTRRASPHSWHRVQLQGRFRMQLTAGELNNNHLNRIEIQVGKANGRQERAKGGKRQNCTRLGAAVVGQARDGRRWDGLGGRSKKLPICTRIMSHDYVGGVWTLISQLATKYSREPHNTMDIPL